jgi:hypothetical protein
VSWNERGKGVRVPRGQECRRSGRSLPCALPPEWWGTTAHARPEHRERSNGCRFAWDESG